MKIKIIKSVILPKDTADKLDSVLKEEKLSFSDWIINAMDDYNS